MPLICDSNLKCQSEYPSPIQQAIKREAYSFRTSLIVTKMAVGSEYHLQGIDTHLGHSNAASIFHCLRYHLQRQITGNLGKEVTGRFIETQKY